MHQYISYEAILELHPPKKELLLNWWNPAPGNRVYHLHKELSGFITHYCPETKTATFQSDEGIRFTTINQSSLFPLLSIGQMIDFIATEHHYVKLSAYSDGLMCRVQGGSSYPRIATELCQALWEEVTQILHVKAM